MSGRDCVYVDLHCVLHYLHERQKPELRSPARYAVSGQRAMLHPRLRAMLHIMSVALTRGESVAGGRRSKRAPTTACPISVGISGVRVNILKFGHVGAAW